MKICIYGAGAAGCVVGAKLKMSGANVTLIGRGKHLRKIQESGLHITTRDSNHIIEIAATDNPISLEPQDYVIIATKAHSIPEIAEKIKPLLHEKTAIIPACNGIPWWFLYNLEGQLKNHRIECLDPMHSIERHIDTKRIIGGVFYMAATLTAPGEVSNFEGPRFIIGEPDGRTSSRVSDLGNILLNAGFKNPVTDNIRGAIWVKLCWNIAFNPLSVIHNMTSGEMAASPEVRKTAEEIMKEAEKIGKELGVKFKLDIEKHVKAAETAGSHKPSMLQDFEHKKPMEINAIIGSACEIAKNLAIKSPYITKAYNQLAEMAQKNTSH